MPIFATVFHQAALNKTLPSVSQRDRFPNPVKPATIGVI